MKHTRHLVVLLFAALAMFSACEDDPVVCSDCGEIPTPSYQPLTTRNAVLNNFELAWNQRRADKLDELLDENYQFYFAPSDVGGGIPAQWSRAEDLTATTYMFESNTSSTPAGPVCTSIRVDVIYEPSELQWVELEPEDFPGETWFMATLFYSYTIEMAGDLVFLAQDGAMAQFVVRETDEGWRLVEWRDLGTDGPPPSRVPAGSETNWGRVKTLYPTHSLTDSPGDR